MKKVSIQIKIGFLMVLAVIILSATGYLSYRNLSSIVSSVQIDMKPDVRLLSIRDISMDLDKAQNSIRIYTSTHDSSDLKPYYDIVAGMGSKLNKLSAQCGNDKMLKSQTDTISRLIDDNIIIWNELVSLNKRFTAIEDLKQLSVRLDSSSIEEHKYDKSILKRVFSRTTKNRLSEGEIINHLKEIELQDSITKVRLMVRESKLAISNTEIKEKFYDLMTKIENEISELIKTKALAADKLAGMTYNWLAMFSICGTLLAILVMFIIVRFVRKTHIYQVALQNSMDEAEKLSKTKELFMANMSHEIRTPVTAISGFTEQLLHDKLDQHTTRSLRIIKSSSDHLTRIINDILDFSKLQNGKLTLEKVHFRIALIMDDVYSLFERQALRNNTRLSLSVSPETPPVLLGDPYRLKQILLNLVSNAVKFTKNGKVHFSLCSKVQDEELMIILEVVDTGIGIDETKIDMIFDDFTQEEMSTTRKYGGTGLGLSIVKKLVELHGGKIEVVSRKNQGTKITCLIPLIEGDENQIKEIEPVIYVPDEIRHLKILIVDDEEYNRLLFKTILERWNVQYKEAGSGIEALEILKTEKFSLLFMDARMPGIDGLKATQFIRTEMNISETEMPVICISAAPVNDDWQRFQKAGMNAFLSKPFTEEMLLTTILSVIKDYAPVIKTGDIDNEIAESEALGKINLKNLYHISGGDEHFVEQMLISFVESTEKGLKEMLASVQAGNNDQIAELAHKLMPPCRHIGADELSANLRKIEENIKNGKDSQNINSLIDNSVKEFALIREMVLQHISKIG